VFAVLTCKDVEQAVESNIFATQKESKRISVESSSQEIALMKIYNWKYFTDMPHYKPRITKRASIIFSVVKCMRDNSLCIQDTKCFLFIIFVILLDINCALFLYFYDYYNPMHISMCNEQDKMHIVIYKVIKL
jgi:hypothetical protein